jgi:hypothetical protein
MNNLKFGLINLIFWSALNTASIAAIKDWKYLSEVKSNKIKTIKSYKHLCLYDFSHEREMCKLVLKEKWIKIFKHSAKELEKIRELDPELARGLAGGFPECLYDFSHEREMYKLTLKENETN